MTRLRRAYLYYNRKWFDGMLPTDIVVAWSYRLPRPCMGISEPDAILLNAKDRRSCIWRMTLLHEMCHLATENERAEHGPKWKCRMRSLARHGAFDKLW